MEKTKDKKKKTRHGKISPGIIIAAFAAAIVVYVVLVYTEKKMTEVERTVPVPIAATEIKKGELIISEGTGVNVIYKEVPESLVPACVIELDAEGQSSRKKYCAGSDINEGSFLTDKMVRAADSYVKRMSNPVLIGFKADDYYQTVGGIIKKDDRIHIYVQDEEGEVSLRWSDVYVAGAFDPSGEEIAPGSEGKSVRYNIYLEKSDVEEFYEKMESKSIRIALACE
ncbi:MAG: hypothetical protein K5669_03425 [Lachnospiraceae bacterium]|nr:hypothetical protein [Lachnospiraceae bacterium]